MHTPAPPDSDLAGLERFVADNDELLELEEAIGRFNIFHALRIERVEIRHSNFLAWLLDPHGTHGQGELFLRAVLMDLLRRSPPELRPLSPVEVDGLELRNIEVVREWNHIDLLVRCDDPPFAIALENKVDAGEHGGQLERYERVLAHHLPELRPMFVFLTPDGAAATGERWVAYSYRYLHAVLRRVRNTARTSLGPDVAIFLDHYLSLIESRLMDNSKLRDLCRRIYANHKRALDLIYEHAEVGGIGVLQTVGDAIAASEGGPWEFFTRTGRWLRFAPSSWLEATPPLATWTRDPRAVLMYEIFVTTDRKVRVLLVVCPCSDIAKRQELIARLTADPAEFGVRVRDKVSSQWTRLWSQTVYKWTDDEEPDADEAYAKAMEAFGQLQSRLRGIDEALRSFFRQ